MKRLLLFTLSIFLIVAMMGCPGRVNRGPGFNRIVVVDGEEKLQKLQTLPTDTFEKNKNAYIEEQKKLVKDGLQDEIIAWNPLTFYGPQYLIYQHTQGDDFHPADMLDDLITEQKIVAIDYVQDYVEIGNKRKYEVISDKVLVTSFYDIWEDGDDANFDGIVNEADEEFYGKYRTTEDGTFVYDDMKIWLVEILEAGDIIEFTLYVEDEDGASAQISGIILIQPKQ